MYLLAVDEAAQAGELALTADRRVTDPESPGSGYVVTVRCTPKSLGALSVGDLRQPRRIRWDE
jgi:hypothetical protein